jgi:hypothetical protein
MRSLAAMWTPTSLAVHSRTVLPQAAMLPRRSMPKSPVMSTTTAEPVAPWIAHSMATSMRLWMRVSAATIADPTAKPAVPRLAARALALLARWIDLVRSAWRPGSAATGSAVPNSVQAAC